MGQGVQAAGDTEAAPLGRLLRKTGPQGHTKKEEKEMLKTDLREFRKELKKAPKEEGIVNWIYAFYVDSENRLSWSSTKRWLEIEEDERFRHYEILNRTASSGIGKTLFPVETEENESLLEFRDLEPGTAPFEQASEQFAAKVMESFRHTDPYYATVTHVTYDVPARATDGSVLEDGGSVYETLIFSICLAKLSAPSLGFEEEEVRELTRRWTIGAPVCGFLYPSFHERAGAYGEASFFVKNDNGYDLLHELFKTRENLVKPEQQKDLWVNVLENSGVDAMAALEVNEKILEDVEESNEPELSKKRLREIVEESGGDGESFETTYDEVVGDKQLSAEAISAAKAVVEMGSVQIRLPAADSAMVQLRNIDGIDYLVLPVDGPISVNGAVLG